MKTLRWATLRKDMGGRYFGEPTAFLALIPLWWGLSLLGELDRFGYETLGASSVANAASFLLLWVVLVISRKTLFRHREEHPISPVVVVTTGAFLGVIKVLVTVVVTSILMDFDLLTGLTPTRLVGGALMGAWIISTSAVVLAIQERFRVERETLMAELLQRPTGKPSANGVDDSSVTGRLREFFLEARRVVVAGDDRPEVLSKGVDRLIDNRLKPLTRDLWFGPRHQYTDFTFRDLVTVFLARQQYRPLLTAVIHVLTTGLFVLSIVSISETVGRQAITAASIWFVLEGLRRLPGHSSTHNALRLFAAVSVFTLLNEGVAYLLFGPFSGISLFFTASGNAAILIVTVMILGITRVAWDDHRTIRAELVEVLGRNYWDSRISAERQRAHHRELADFLHGQVQSRLLSVALAARNSNLTPSPDALLREIDLLQSQIPEQGKAPIAEMLSTVDEQFHALQERWRGIITVTFDASADSPLSPEQISSLIKITEEAVTNALRHGDASTIHVKITNTPDGVRLTATDNGAGPQGGRPGLGSLTFSSGGTTTWSLSPASAIKGTTLVVDLPA